MKKKYFPIFRFAAIFVIAAILFFAFPIFESSSLLSAGKDRIETINTGSTQLLQIGEELVYKVSYSIFTLGRVKITIADTSTKNGKKFFIAKAFIDSEVPFVNVHQVFYSEIDPNLFSRFFIIHDTKDPNRMYYIKYDFDYPKNKVYYETGWKPDNTIVKKGEEKVFEEQQDGLSLFFFARGNLHNKGIIDCPIFINEKTFNAHFNFLGKVGSQKIDAVKYPIETKEFEGKAEFTGIFGLTGEFRGYFSNDDAGVPIVAKMKVILGSVHIELEKWNRAGWEPPKAKK